MKPGEYKVHALDVVQSYKKMRMDFEIVEGAHAGEKLSLHIDCVDELEIERPNGLATIRTTFDKFFATSFDYPSQLAAVRPTVPIEQYDYDALYSAVAALRVGQSMKYREMTIKRVS